MRQEYDIQVWADCQWMSLKVQEMFTLEEARLIFEGRMQGLCGQGLTAGHLVHIYNWLGGGWCSIGLLVDSSRVESVGD